MNRAARSAVVHLLAVVAYLCAAAGLPAAEPKPQAQQLIDRGLAFLKSQQKEDGGWQRPNEPPGVTAIVLRAFVADSSHDASTDFVRRGYEKLFSYQQPNGGIYQDMLANYNTSIAISAMAAAEEPAFRERMERAVAFLKRLQYNDRADNAP